MVDFCLNFPKFFATFPSTGLRNCIILLQLRLLIFSPSSSGSRFFFFSGSGSFIGLFTGSGSDNWTCLQKYFSPINYWCKLQEKRKERLIFLNREIFLFYLKKSNKLTISSCLFFPEVVQEPHIICVFCFSIFFCPLRGLMGGGVIARVYVK